MNVIQASYEVREVEGVNFTNPRDIYSKLKEQFNPLQEEFFIIPTINQECLIEKLFTGGLDASNVDPRTMFHKLLTEYPNCRAFLVAHNHPSGNNEPSGADKLVTIKIKEACKIMDYTLLDHIVFSNTGYYSFNDQGVL